MYIVNKYIYNHINQLVAGVGIPAKGHKYRFLFKHQ